MPTNENRKEATKSKTKKNNEKQEKENAARKDRAGEMRRSPSDTNWRSTSTPVPRHRSGAAARKRKMVKSQPRPQRALIFELFALRGGVWMCVAVQTTERERALESP